MSAQAPGSRRPDGETYGLVWEASYAIARALMQEHGDVRLEEVSLDMIFRWTLALPHFRDDPALANDEILLAIYREWFEETSPL